MPCCKLGFAGLWARRPVRCCWAVPRQPARACPRLPLEASLFGARCALPPRSAPQHRHHGRHREGQGPVQGPPGADPGLQHLPAQGARPAAGGGRRQAARAAGLALRLPLSCMLSHSLYCPFFTAGLRDPSGRGRSQRALLGSAGASPRGARPSGWAGWLRGILHSARSHMHAPRPTACSLLPRGCSPCGRRSSSPSRRWSLTRPSAT